MDYSLEELKENIEYILTSNEKGKVKTLNDAKQERAFKLITGEKGLDMFYKQILVSQLYKDDRFTIEEKRNLARLILSEDKELNTLGSKLYANIGNEN